MAKNILTHNLSEHLTGATTATVDISAGDGNLTVDRLAVGEQLLASGALQYLENQGVPTQTLVSGSGRAALMLKGGKAARPWFHLPWAACHGATEWQIHLNPTVVADISAHSDGGNVRLNLAGMSVKDVSADTGGGNMDIVLPDHAADLSATAKTGAGNVTVEIGSGLTGSNIVNAGSGAGDVVVRIPSDVAARIHVTTGLGKAIVDPWFSQTDQNTYQSPDYDSAANKVEITAHSGAGNVSVNIK